LPLRAKRYAGVRAWSLDRWSETHFIAARIDMWLDIDQQKIDTVPDSGSQQIAGSRAAVAVVPARQNCSWLT
jgi:hypothetical protein